MDGLQEHGESRMEQTVCATIGVVEDRVNDDGCSDMSDDMMPAHDKQPAHGTGVAAEKISVASEEGNRRNETKMQQRGARRVARRE